MKLSSQMWRMLSDAAEGNAYARIRGQSAHGGAWGTSVALIRRGLLDLKLTITPAGRAALEARAAKERP